MRAACSGAGPSVVAKAGTSEVDTATGFDGLIAYFRRIGARRDDLPYDIDGVVYKLDDYDGQAEMGFRAPLPGIRR